MLKFESFCIVHISNNYSGSVVITKNCSQKRALRLWKKFLKKNYNFPKGTYAVTYRKRHFEVKSLAEVV